VPEKRKLKPAGLDRFGQPKQRPLDYQGGQTVETATGRITSTGKIIPDREIRRNSDGTYMPGYGPAGGGATKLDIVALRERYRGKLPQLMENLFVLAAPDKPFMVQIAATKEILDRLIGKPQVTIDAVTTRVDVAALYLNAMKRANAGLSEAQVIDAAGATETTPANAHIVPSAPEVGREDDGKPCGIGTS
jgi:hypothetical protein